MRYANIQRAFSLILRILSLNSYARYYRSFKYCNKVLPVYCIIPTLYFHELVTLYEGLLMKVVGIALIVYHANLAMVFRHEHVNIAVHADLTLVFRHEHVNITIQRITVVSTADYLTYTLSLASHVMKLRKVVEVVKTVDAQHKPSSFSTNVFSP